MRKLSLLLLALLLLGIVAIIPASAQGGSIVDVASSSNQFSVLVQAVTAADPGVAEALSTGGPYTVFAPTNDAFTRLALEFGFELEDLLADTDLLTRLLQYHVIEGEVFSGQAISLVQGSASGEVTVPTLLAGTAVGLSLVDGQLTLNRVVEVVLPDIDASNGVIHGINDVIFPGVLREELEGLGGPETNSIVDVASANEDFSTLVAVVEASGNTDLLSVGFPFTVFAPTNAAFEALFEEVGLTAEEALAQPELLNTILRYHILDDQVTSDVVVTLDGASVETLQGESINIAIVTPEEEGAAPQVVLNDSATVTAVDITADNGVIHVIDAVLVPQEALDQLEIILIEEGTIAGVVRDTEGFSTLLAVMQASGNIDLLERGFPFTVFAPTDDAFAALFADLGISAEDALANPELLNVVLRYHILEEQLDERALLLNSGASYETLQGEEVTVTAGGGALTVNGASVVMSDVEASNGIVHVIDAVLVPQEAVDLLAAGGEEEAAAEEEVTEEAPAEEAAAEETEESSEEAAAGSIADIVAGDSNFSILLAIVDATGQTETLATGGPFTVFAPTDEAFTALLDGLGVTADMALGLPELLQPILLYHVVEGAVPAADVVALDGQTVATLQGEEITISVTDAGVVLTSPAGSVNVTVTDIMASNGIVHVIDGVLVPQQTIDELAALGIVVGG